MINKMYTVSRIEDLIMETKLMNQEFKNPANLLIRSIFGDAVPFGLINYLLSKHTTFLFFIGDDGQVAYNGIEEINPIQMAEYVSLYYESEDDEEIRLKKNEYLTNVDFKFVMNSGIKDDEFEFTIVRFFIDRYLNGETEYISDKKSMNGWCIKALNKLIKAGCSS